jgi:hypothetical protein
MFAIFYAAVLGLCVARRPSPLGHIAGAWAIVALALTALAVPQIDLVALAANTGLALLGYNLALVAGLVTAGWSTSRPLRA